MAIDWIIVKNSYNKKPIGALGFVDNKIAIVTAFFDDKDANQDGSVSMIERFGSLFRMKGRALAEVASHAYADPDLLMRDPGLAGLRGKLLSEFAFGLIAEGVYITYFSAGVRKAAGALAGQISANPIKSFVIRKGMEAAVKKAYLETAR